LEKSSLISLARSEDASEKLHIYEQHQKNLKLSVRDCGALPFPHAEGVPGG
jgi:hypothetical protein